MISLLRPTSLKRIVFFVLADLFLSLLTLYAAYVLRFGLYIDKNFLASFALTYTALTALKIASLLLFKVYFVVWRFFGFEEAKNIVKAHIVAYLSFIGIYIIFSDTFAPFPRSIIAIDFFLSLFIIGGLRISKRLLIQSSYNSGMKQTLIVGVGSGTSAVIRNAMDGDIDYYPVAIVALERGKNAINSYISNLKVYDYSQLAQVIRKKEIKAAIISRELSTNELKEVVEHLNNYGITEIKRIRFLGSHQEKLEDLSIEDLLARHPKDLDQECIASFVKGKRVLVTGAGGSIGSEIARQCATYGASSLILVDNSEYNLYSVGEQVEDAVLSLLDITDDKLLEKLFVKYKPEIVIHAAAYKHVPICEDNQESAIYNNVIGTKIVVDLSVAYDVTKLVIISTDKAVRPTNVMGATKRVTELYASNVESKNTEIVAVRFGNVLGSSGSVIPKFKRQIEQGGPITVTDPEITRYFMLIPEACQLVLQAGAIAKGGELFVLDMGKPIKISDMAEQMIRLYGKEGEIEIVYSGLRPGEKLYEELLLDESEKKTQYSSIFIAQATYYPIEELERDIESLLNSEDKIEALQKIVPEFSRESMI